MTVMDKLLIYTLYQHMKFTLDDAECGEETWELFAGGDSFAIYVVRRTVEQVRDEADRIITEFVNEDFRRAKLLMSFGYLDRGCSDVPI